MEICNLGLDLDGSHWIAEFRIVVELSCFPVYTCIRSLVNTNRSTYSQPSHLKDIHYFIYFNSWNKYTKRLKAMQKPGFQRPSILHQKWPRFWRPLYQSKPVSKNKLHLYHQHRSLVSIIKKNIYQILVSNARMYFYVSYTPFQLIRKSNFPLIGSTSNGIGY